MLEMVSYPLKSGKLYCTNIQPMKNNYATCVAIDEQNNKGIDLDNGSPLQFVHWFGDGTPS